MISVPLAGLLPSTPRAVRCMNGSITSCGKPCGYVGSGCGVTIPISSQWPIVVSLPFDRSSRRPATAGAPACGGTALERLDVAEAERLQVRQVEPADGARDVAERVGALVAELVGVRQRAGTDGIEHDHARPRHRAILGARWTPSLAFFGLAVYIVGVIALAAGVTWLVVRISPTRDPKPARSTSASREQRVSSGVYSRSCASATAR